MIKAKQKKRGGIVTLLWFLIIIAVLLNVIILGIFRESINDYNRQTNRLTSIERGLNSFRKDVEDYRKDEQTNLKTLLDPSLIEVSTGKIARKKLSAFTAYRFITQSPELNSLLEDFFSASKEIYALEDDIILWRKGYSSVFRDIKNNITLNKVRNKVVALNNALSSFEGKRKLQEAKRLRMIRNAKGQEEEKLSARYVRDLLDQSKMNINLLRYELNDLALFVEKLNSERNLYDLPDLRDNKIKQSLARVHRIISREAPGKGVLSSEAINELARLIFGRDYYLDKAHQTIVIGGGGYFDLRQKYLEYLLEREELVKRLDMATKKIDQTILVLNESIQNIKTSVLDEQKLLFSNTWTKVLGLSMLFLFLFISIAMYIAFLVKKQIEKEEKIQNEINSLIEGTGDAMRVIAPDYRVIRVNSKMAEITGVTPEDSIGKNCYKLMPGAECHTDHCAIKMVIERKGPVQIETIKKDKSGRDVPFDVIAAPLMDSNGRIISIIESYRDVSEYKKLQKKIENSNKELLKKEEALNSMLADLQKSNQELKSTQKQLIRSEKMASVGQLSAGVAHEINNPTGFVLNNLQVLTGNIETLFQVIREAEALMKKYFSSDDANAEFYSEFKKIVENDEMNFLKEDLPALISQSLDGMRRIQKIVGNLKDFAHPGEEGKKPTDVNQEIIKALNLIHNEIKYTCEVEKDLNDVPEVNANPQQLEQVFINIIVNASQAIEGRGVVNVSTRFQDPYVVVEISDNGKGIPKEDSGKIFNPFFTTKDVGKGTGLGLSIVYGIIEDHDGKIDVESEVGRGTKFIISLPANS